MHSLPGMGIKGGDFDVLVLLLKSFDERQRFMFFSKERCTLIHCPGEAESHLAIFAPGSRSVRGLRQRSRASRTSMIYSDWRTSQPAAHFQPKLMAVLCLESRSPPWREAVE